MWWTALTFLCVSFITPLRVTWAGDFERLIRLTVEFNAAAAQSQRRVAELSDQTAEMASRYRAVQEQIESLRLYRQQVESLVGAQATLMADLEARIEQATTIGRDTTPLMLRMIDALAAFVRLDVPFLVEERAERITQLRTLMSRPDVSDAERFRRILEAYQAESEYGRTVESYRGTISPPSGEPRTVEILRVGRIALLYLTLDGQEVGRWDAEGGAWELLPLEMRRSVREGIKIARKQAAPSLFRIPVPVPKDVEGPQPGPIEAQPGEPS